MSKPPKITFQTPKLQTLTIKSLTFSKKKKKGLNPFFYICYNSHEKKFADMIYDFQYTTL